MASGSAKIEVMVNEFVDAFFRDADMEKVPVKTVRLEPQNHQWGAGAKRAADALSIRHEKGGLVCTLDLTELAGVPEPALQGWTDMSLAKALMENDSRHSHFNFSRRILPLFPVSGSAVNFVRYIVECLSKGLKGYLATQRLIRIGHGPPQAHFLFFRMYFPREDVLTGQMVAPHHWTKAVFLCRRLESYMTLWVLARQGVAFSVQLQEAWDQAHDYLTPEDKTFMNELGSIPERRPGGSYADHMVAMFLEVRDRYLHRRLVSPEGKEET